MKILAFEFSSSRRSVAVLSPDLQGEPVVCESVESTPGNTMRPLSMVEEVLKQVKLEREEVECVAVGLGPGSYTGIRVAIALAQGWQLACGVKLLGISSADCIVAQALLDTTGRCCVVIDAQREEFYIASYEFEARGARGVQPLKLAARAEVRERERAGEVLVGPEVTRWFPDGRVVFPRAADLSKLALGRRDFVTGEKLEPLYLRETNFVKAKPALLLP